MLLLNYWWWKIYLFLINQTIIGSFSFWSEMTWYVYILNILNFCLKPDYWKRNGDYRWVTVFIIMKTKKLHRKNTDSFMQNFKEEEEQKKIPPSFPQAWLDIHFLSTFLLNSSRGWDFWPMYHDSWQYFANHDVIIILRSSQKCCPANQCAKQDF